LNNDYQQTGSVEIIRNEMKQKVVENLKVQQFPFLNILPKKRQNLLFEKRSTLKFTSVFGCEVSPPFPAFGEE
jgi:hypothetical protein